MRPPPASDNRRIVLLKLTVKLMFLALITALVLTMVSALLPDDEPPPVPLRVDVSRLAVGGMQGLEWNRQRILVVHRDPGANYLVIADYDPLYGCPLSWVAAGNAEAPQQPWPGGLRAICTAHWYDSNGVSLTPGVTNLKQLPFNIEEPGTLVITATSN